MKYPTARFVFDRKHTASKTTKGTVQIEILFERKRKWISTGVRLYSDQCINRKTFCDAFPNHFVSVLHLLTQNELRFFIHFPTLLKGLSKSI